MKQVSITKAVKIKNQRVKLFDGAKEYLATGGLIGDKVKTELVTYKTKPSRADLLVAENQLIVARMKETNKVLLIDENTRDLIVSTGFLVLDVQDGWHPGFLFHYFASSFFQKQKDKLSIGATQKAINNNKFKEILIPELSFEDQKRIVTILDKADALRQKRKQSIRLLDDYLKSVFLEMFGDPVKNPKGWKVVTLEKIIIDVKNGATRRRKEFENKGDIVLRLRDIRENNIDFTDNNRIALNISEKEKFKIDIHDILFIRVNGNPDYVGRSAVFNGYHEDVYYNDHIMRIKVKSDQINEPFLCFFINSKFGKRQIFLYKKTSAGQHTINQDGLNKIRIFLPPIKQQNNFTTAIKKVESLKQSMLTQSAEIETQFQVLMQKAFKGEL